MDYDNSNVPMECSDCGAIAEGIPAMISHIIDFHKNYTLDEAMDYAERWAARAYQQIEEEGYQQTRDFRINGCSKDHVSGGSL